MAPPQRRPSPWTFHNGRRAGSWAEPADQEDGQRGQGLRYGTPWRLGMQRPVVRAWVLLAGWCRASGLLSRLWLLWVRAGLTPHGTQAEASFVFSELLRLPGEKERRGTSFTPTSEMKREPGVPEASQHPY